MTPAIFGTIFGFFIGFATGFVLMDWIIRLEQEDEDDDQI